MHKLMMGVNAVPNDDDDQDAWMGGHKTGVDGLASGSPKEISLKTPVWGLTQRGPSLAPSMPRRAALC